MDNQTSSKMFPEPCQLDIQTEVGVSWAEILPTVSSSGDTLVNVVETGQKYTNSSVHILAGLEDGSIMLAEMMIPEPGINHEIHRVRKHKEIQYLHKDVVTSIRQRPEYPFQYLTTSLDGDAVLALMANSLGPNNMITEFSQIFSTTISNSIHENGIGDALWMDVNSFIAKNEVYGLLVVQDVREGQGKAAQHVYSTPTMAKINDMSMVFPYWALAWDDGNMSILDLRKVDIDTNNNLVPLYNVQKKGEACMWVKVTSTFIFY